MIPSIKANTLHAFFSLFLLFFTITAEARPSDKWRLHVNGSADSDGVVTISVQPEDGAAIMVAAKIDNRTRENMVAKEISKALKKQLPDGEYSVSRDDGEEVKINAKRGTSDFEVSVVSNTVDGVRVRSDRK